MSKPWKKEYLKAIVRAWSKGESLDRIAQALENAGKPITKQGLLKWIREYESEHGPIERERKLPKL